MTRDNLINVFLDTKKLYTENQELQVVVKNSIANTVFYPEGDTPKLGEKRFEKTAVTVTKYRSLESAMYYKRKNPKKRVGILNFASATNPGGGVRNGSRAQEEALCRCTTLLPVLDTQENWQRYYKFHRKRNNACYTDACIYTPDIISVKSDTDLPVRLKEKEWQKFDILTAAAPNLRPRPSNNMNPDAGNPVNLSDKELLDIHKQRGRHILSVAAYHNVDIMILGAFGCGAFRNDPKIVASAYKEILPEFDGYFSEISFTVFCSERDKLNYEVFKKILG